MGDALHEQQRPAPNRSALSFCVIAAIICALLAGCGYSGPTNASTAVALSGSVHGGRQPVSGSTIQLYAAGTDGDGSVALPLLSSTVKTDSNGNFTIPAAYGCPSASSPVYVVASAGSPGTSASNNPDLVLTAVLGACGKLSGSTPISVNEVTTVGSVFPLAAYMTDAKHLGSASGDASFLTAVATVPEFINSAQGSSPGTATASSYFAESAKLNSLANAMADCVNSSGGSTGDGSPCGQLFAAATPAGGNAPSDTVTAALRIAQNPKNNVANIYSLAVANPPFEPALTTAPTNWALALSFAVAAPNISLPTGIYNGTQEVTLSDSTAGSTLYYTTDGTVPTASSSSYTGPIAVSVSTTLQAIAVLQGSESSVASSTLTITAANPPEKLVFQQQPSNTPAGATITPAVTVMVEDINGNVVPSAADAIKLTLVGGSGLQGTLTITPQNGIATFNDLSVSAPGSGYTLLATSPSLPPAISAPFVITPSVSSTPVTLSFLQQPSNALTKATIAPAVTVVVEDGSGNPVTNATNPVTLALTGVSGLAGTLTATPQNGIATFTDLSVGTAGTYTLTATSPNLTSATSASFVITALGGSAPPPPVKLAFLQQPTNALTGATIAPAVTVVVEDSNGNTVPTAINPVTLTLVGGTGLGGTLSVVPKNGIATFNNLNVSNAGTYTLVAISTSLVPAISKGFTISAPGGGVPVAAKLAFLQQPSNALAGATIAPAVTVAIEDSNGNTVTAATNPVTLALTTGSGLAGTLTATPQNGVATFSGLSVSNAGSYTLSASGAGLTPAISSSFTISAAGGGTPPPTASKLAFVQQPSNASTGATITPAVTVAVQDSNGNTVTTATNPVTLALSSGTGLAGTLTATPQNGIATFSNLSVSAAGTYTLSASSAGLTPATSNSFTISAAGGGTPPPTAAKLAFVQQPSNASTGATITPAVTVAVQDSNGNTVTTATNPVTLTLGGGTGLAGTLTVTPQNGIATFSNLSVSIAGTYTLSASSASLTSATSNNFTISALAAIPAKLAFLQQPSSALTGATITPAITVVVEDSNGNPVTTATNAVTVALTTGTGLSGTLTATPQNGVATFSNLSESTAGRYTLSATSTGLTSATSSSFTISTQSTTGANYYISPGGSDSNSGTSPSSPWLTPNHAITCGDVISAAPGTYSAGNFGNGKWGTVSCPAGNNVAWLQCATFDTCKITATGSDAMWVDKSYWGVQGWETSTHTTNDGACFHVGPSSGGVVHHVIFANDVANGCMGGGFNAYSTSTSSSVDYITYLGDVAYNAAQGSGACYSGFNVYQPIASDTAGGTHNYVAGSFAYANVDGDPCAGTAPTDGEGINFDTWDFDQGKGTPYTQQGAMENNIAVFNGGRGIYVENNNAGSAHASIYMNGNTLFGNNAQMTQAYCSGNGDLTVYNASDVTANGNLIQTNSATMCTSAQPKYAIAISTDNATVTINDNYASGTSGNNTFSYGSGSFAFGAANVIGTNPAYANPVNPGAPSCSGSANVPACMATLIANFTPTNAAAKAFGYQPPSATSTNDPLFPQWLCSVNLPAGLVTKGCN
jgi:Chitobiase/beta-hexosaminidase C-terminal domain